MKDLIKWICIALAAWFILQIPSCVGCWIRWKDSGMDSRYIFSGGCQVGYDGEFIPEKNVRRNY